MTNKWNTVLYTGVTSDLLRRVCQHQEKTIESFTKKYNLTKLVYYEFFETIQEAIAREKRIKGGSRKSKVQLIQTNNPDWNDLSEML